MVFNQEFEFCSQNFVTSLLRNSIFLLSEPCSLRLSKIERNHSASMIIYLKELLILSAAS